MGGIQWQVQEIRITSGNTSIGMLLIATMGIVLHAALKIGNPSIMVQTNDQSQTSDFNHGLSENDVAFSRFNSLVMMVGYVSYIIFQLGSHKNEFDYNCDEYSMLGGGTISPSKYNKGKTPASRRNSFCKRHCFVMNYCRRTSDDVDYNETNSGTFLKRITEYDFHFSFTVTDMQFIGTRCTNVSKNGTGVACNHHIFNFYHERRNR